MNGTLEFKPQTEEGPHQDLGEAAGYGASQALAAMTSNANPLD